MNSSNSSSETSDVSSLVRLLSVLDLFTEDRLIWTTEAIAKAMAVSVPTSYRYVKVLLDAGLLQRAANAQVTLGARIMALDHIIRMADPVLNVGKPFMQELTEQTGFDCVMSGLYGEQMIDTHREYGKTPLSLSYGRGRLRPLYRGGAPKAILSCYSPAQLRKLFDAHFSEIVEAKLPADWTAHRQYFRAIRKAGYYFSSGELEPELAALAAPLQKSDGTIWGAVSVVSTVSRMSVVDVKKLAQLVMRTAQDITARIP
jgi:DNA-binding IclR family transcriptional regulator